MGRQTLPLGPEDGRHRAAKVRVFVAGVRWSWGGAERSICSWRCLRNRLRSGWWSSEKRSRTRERSYEHIWTLYRKLLECFSPVYLWHLVIKWNWCPPGVPGCFGPQRCVEWFGTGRGLAVVLVAAERRLPAAGARPGLSSQGLEQLPQGRRLAQRPATAGGLGGLWIFGGRHHPAGGRLDICGKLKKKGSLGTKNCQAIESCQGAEGFGCFVSFFLICVVAPSFFGGFGPASSADQCDWLRWRCSRVSKILAEAEIPTGATDSHGIFPWLADFKHWILEYLKSSLHSIHIV